MYDHYKEASLSLTYRRKEIECIVAPLVTQRSVRVAGLSGMGKSNLLRFLVSHPQILENNLALSATSVCFLYIDCNRLNPISALSFYREGNFLLHAEATTPASSDEYLAFKQFEAALRQLDQQTLVILVVDRAENLYDKIGGDFFSQLRNLRDEARAGRMIFILASRRPVGHLYELEKLFSDTCWVGPLTVADEGEFLTRHEARLGINLGEELRQLLWRLSGGHPGLLKNGLEWMKRQGLENIPKDETHLTQNLLDHEPIQRYCRQLWGDLTPAEQGFLANLDSTSQESAVVYLLKKSGLIIEEKGELRIFSPLWEVYLKQNTWLQQEVKPLQIELDPATRRVALQWRGKTAETVITRPLVFEFLRLLATAPGRIYSKDELISALYQDDKAPEVMDDALFQLVTALRKSLDSLVQDLCPAMTASSIQNVRGVGYQLIVDLPIRSGHR